MRLTFLRPLLLATVILVGLGTVSLFNKKTYSLSLNNVAATLSNSRLSFKGALASGNLAGQSYAYINTTQGAYPSTSASQLAQGDVVRIGETTSLGSYTIASTSANNLIYLTTALAAGDADANDDVISTQSANLTVRLTTVNAISNGRFRILIPAESDDARSTDGIPDASRWDGGFNNSSPNIASTITCPSDVGATYDFVAGTATRSATLIGSIEYHSFECAYSGAGAIGTAFTTFSINNLINPAPAPDHTIGIADVPRIIVQHVNNQFQVVDQTIVAVGLIEAVKITASVAPQISFRIEGVPSGTAGLCDSGLTSVSTSPNNVSFGELLIDQFTYAAQFLRVSTNAVNGYGVTVRANDQMGRNGADCSGDPGKSSALDPRTLNNSCIPDTLGQGASTAPTTDDMTSSNQAEWSSPDYKGLGYSLEDVNNVSGMTEAFQFNSSTGSCNGGGTCYRQFADAQAAEAAQTLISSTAPADNHNVYICYKAVISNTQAAGDYENFLTFIATATF